MADAQFRVGHQIAEFGGIDRDHDPAAIPVHRFRDLINVRLQGKLVSRGGQEKLNPNDLFAGCVNGIFGSEYQFPSDFTAGGQVLTIPGTGESFAAVPYTGRDGSMLGQVLQVIGSDVAQIQMDATLTLNYMCCVSYGGATVLGVFDTTEGVERPSSLRTGAGAILATFEAHETVWALAVVGANLFAAVTYVDPDTEHVTFCRVYLWNGTSLTQDHEFAAGDNQPTNLAVYNNAELLATVSNSTVELWHRTALGAWSQPALPVGVSEFTMNSSATLGVKLYVGGTGIGISSPVNKGHILSWDGAAFALEREIDAVGLGATANVGAMTVSGTVLYYGHTDSVSVLKIGTYDGATWTDNAADLLLVIPAANPGTFSEGSITRNIVCIAIWWDSDSIIHVVFVGGNPETDGAWLSVASSDLASFALHWNRDYGPLDLRAGRIQGEQNTHIQQKQITVVPA